MEEAAAPPDLRHRIAAELAAAFDGAEPTAPEDRLAGVIVELQRFARELGRMGPELAPALRARAESLAADVDKALGRHFQEVTNV